MNNLELYKKIGVGLIPLLAFILIDEFWGTEQGLIAAIVIGLGQLGYVWFKEKKLDKFILLDTSLIVILGVVSLLSHDAIFVKVKPAIIEFIMVALVGFSAFGSMNLIIGMQKRYVGEVKLNDLQLRKMQFSMRIMFFVLLGHTLLTLYSAFYMSKEAWAFISTALLYIIFGLIFGVQLLVNQIQKRRIEWLPIVDDDGNLKGKAPRDVCHNDNTLLHPVVRLHIFNSSGQIYLQQRSKKSYVAPGLWDAAVAGHVQFGETLEQALQREAMEELNIKGFESQLFRKSKYIGEKDAELVFTFISVFDGKIEPNKKEVEDGRFFTFDYLQNKFSREDLTPAIIAEIIDLQGVSKKLFKHK